MDILRKVPIPGKEPKKVVFPCCLVHLINAEILEMGVGPAIVLDTCLDEVWILNEAVFKHLGTGIKVEAANTDQTSGGKIGNVSDKTLIEV